jgi:catechol 2,3-dioxygenase
MTVHLTRRRLLALAGASTLAVAAARAALAEGIDPASAAPTFANRTPMRIGAASLRVRDLDAVADFYRDVIGLRVMERTAETARLGAGGVTLLVLERKPEAAIEAREAAGLYHTAFLMPTRKDLARWLVHVAVGRVPLTGFADHLVSEAVYLDDPEGNGIEVYADRSPVTWKWQSDGVAMATDPLDVDDLLTLADIRRDDYAGAPDGMRIGHVHLKVGDIAKADAFYRELIGLETTRRFDSASFLSSGKYHHHMGLNTWQSAGAGVRDMSETGLAWFSIEVAGDFAAHEERLAKAEVPVASVTGGIETGDPWGTRVRLVRV